MPEHHHTAGVPLRYSLLLRGRPLLATAYTAATFMCMEAYFSAKTFSAKTTKSDEILKTYIFFPTAHIISGFYSNCTCVRMFYHMIPRNDAGFVWVTPIY